MTAPADRMTPEERLPRSWAIGLEIASRMFYSAHDESQPRMIAEVIEKALCAAEAAVREEIAGKIEREADEYHDADEPQVSLPLRSLAAAVRAGK